MSFMKYADVNVTDAYEKSFGSMRDETIIDDPMNGIFGAETFTKAVNVGAASGAAGYAMTPLAYDQKVTDITRRMTPVKGLIPTVTNFGTTANYYRITARGGGTWGTEQAALTESDDTTELASSTIKYVRVTGKVTGVADSGSRHFIDSMRQEVLNKTQTMNEEIESSLINGDTATYPLEPNGLIKLCTSNNTNMSGTAVALTDVKTAVADAFSNKGKPNLIITDAYTALNLENQMMDYVRYVNPFQNFAWGLDALTLSTVVGKIPIVVSQFMPTATTARRILVVDTNMLEQRVLQDVTFEKLAKTEDGEKFFLKSYRTLINRFPEGMAQIYGIE